MTWTLVLEWGMVVLVWLAACQMVKGLVALDKWENEKEPDGGPDSAAGPESATDGRTGPESESMWQRWRAKRLAGRRKATMNRNDRLTKRQQELVARARLHGDTPAMAATDYRLDRNAVKAFLESEEGRAEIERQGRLYRREPPPALPPAKQITAVRAHQARSRMVQLREQAAVADGHLKSAEMKLREAVRLRDTLAKAGGEDAYEGTADMVAEATWYAEEQRAAAHEAAERVKDAERAWRARKREAEAAGLRNAAGEAAA